MNQSRFTGKLFYAAVLFLLCSCGSNEEKAGSETVTTDTMAANTDVTPAPVAASTISTSPQIMMVARHRVANYGKWQASYDSFDSLRLANGLHNYVIGRSVADSNIILVAIKVDDMAKAKAFAKDPALKQAMQKGGVIGAPTIAFSTTIYQDTADITSRIRSMNTMTVKDRDAWYKSFQEGKQERLDNGIVERVIAQDADNDKKMILVTAITDTAKANAYVVSDALKKRREAGGVIGMPERFVFEVVKRY
jgi:hypothetical protein